MKTITLFIIFIFAGLFIKAQQSDLINNTWYLQKMISSNGIEILPPNNSEVNVIQANFGETLMNTSVVNQFGAWTFPGPHIAITNTTIQYDEYGYSTNPCQIVENCTFENNYFNIFKDGLFGIPIYYIITNENNYLKLTLTNNNGNQTIYYSQNLSVNDQEKKRFKVYPNPVGEILTIETEKQNNELFITIFDFQGKRVLNDFIKNSKKYNINLSNLVSGVYILNIKKENKIYTTQILKK